MKILYFRHTGGIRVKYSTKILLHVTQQFLMYSNSTRDTATFQFVPQVVQVADSRNDYIWIVGNNFKHICVVIYLKTLLFQVIYCRYQ